VLRVLGNLLELDGFDYVHSNEVFAEVGSALESTLVFADMPLDAEAAETLMPTQLISMYQVDALVRRAKSLQATPDANVNAR